MEPRIQYTKTSDGVSIAYFLMGRGLPLVATSPAMFSNIAQELRTPDVRAWYESLAAHRLLVRFDWRGMGMSQRDVDNFSLNALTSDVEAVVDALGVEVVDLLGIFGPGQEMVAFAARNPARVRRMVLWATPVDNSDIFSERVDAVLSLAQRDRDLFLETFAHNLVGWSRGQTGHEWAQLIRAAIAQPQFLRLFPELAKHDITPLLGRVQALTLVLHRPDVLAVAAEHARLIASAVPGAQIAQIEEGGFSPDESPSGTKLMLDFLEAGSDTQALEPRPSDTAIILFADITDSTALTESLGDAAFRRKARVLDATLRAVIREHSGTAIEGKLLGDGFSPSSLPPGRQSRLHSPAAVRAATRGCHYTLACTPAMSSAKRTTSTAGPSTSPRGLAVCPHRARCWCRIRCGRWRERRRGCGSRTGGSKR